MSIDETVGGETVDPVLIEKITKLVIEKLEGVERKPKPHALTNEEIKRWNEIASALKYSEVSVFPSEGQSEPLPLSEEEIRRWKHLTFSLKNIKPEMAQGQEQVKFHQHN
ncbi:hypothetical protein DCC39_02515 [Pueribacillus theae]|uniref:Uncharacterized protein n=1 Tax=Pueribacillus theae TaxID=2171751 RepID=A0A2U1K731_9BACI|nr:hypothetical protein [Pueribacillus theae]PWA13024.1 hypothetical protein DCC39_02515 [Pueribacillus theae]